MRRKDREVTDKKEIGKILDGCKTASVAMVDEEIPYVIPLSYGYELIANQLVLYFHGAKEGRKVDVMKKNSTVGFAVFSEGEPVYAEIPCNSGYYFSSVVGTGTVEFVDELEEKKRGLSIMFAQQAGREVVFTDEQASSVCVFKIVSNDFTGKQKPMM